MRVVLGLVLLLAGCSHGSRVEPTEPRGTAPREGAHGDLGPGATGTLPPGAAQVDAEAVTPPAPPAKIKITVRTTPPKVMVSWGKKKLGLTPLSFERPRDSGPIDLVLRAAGYFPLHTRAYTVKNDVIVVKMTKLADRMSVFGAKQEIPDDLPYDPTLDPNNALKGTPPPGAPTPAVPPPPTAPPPEPTPPGQ